MEENLQALRVESFSAGPFERVQTVFLGLTSRRHIENHSYVAAGVDARHACFVLGQVNLEMIACHPTIRLTYTHVAHESNELVPSPNPSELTLHFHRRAFVRGERHVHATVELEGVADDLIHQASRLPIQASAQETDRAIRPNALGPRPIVERCGLDAQPLGVRDHHVAF